MPLVCWFGCLWLYGLFWVLVVCSCVLVVVLVGLGLFVCGLFLLGLCWWF